MVLSLVRWMPICVPAMIPNRYSRPICAPPSKPKNSRARSPKSPEPSERVKRCVTRNALAKRGIFSVVGSPMMVKSGCEGFTARSLTAGSSCGVTAGFSCGSAGGACAAGDAAARNASATAVNSCFIRELVHSHREPTGTGRPQLDSRRRTWRYWCNGNSDAATGSVFSASFPRRSRDRLRPP